MGLHLQQRQALRVRVRWQALRGALWAPRAAPGRQRCDCPKKGALEPPPGSPFVLGLSLGRSRIHVRGCWAGRQGERVPSRGAACRLRRRIWSTPPASRPWTGSRTPQSPTHPRSPPPTRVPPHDRRCQRSRSCRRPTRPCWTSEAVRKNASALAQRRRALAPLPAAGDRRLASAA